MAKADMPRSGLLDVTVELSSPAIFAGEAFSVYLLVKNPFEQPIWIKEVTVSVPSQLYWRGRREEPHLGLQDASQQTTDLLEHADLSIARTIAERNTRINALERELVEIEVMLADDQADDRQEDLIDERNRIHRELQEEENRLHSDVATYSSNPSRHWLIQLAPAFEEKTRRVLIRGSIPPEAAVQTGSTGVWPIELGTKRNVFFFPTQYRLQFNVVYSFQSSEDGESAERQMLRAETIAKTLTIRASMWAMMAGAVLGGALGSLAQSLQQLSLWSSVNASAVEITMTNIVFGALPTLLLSIILSVAAIIFTARKSEAQFFVSVEDFWGGALIGFLIGFSGTAAFANVTGSQTVAAVTPTPTIVPGA